MYCSFNHEAEMTFGIQLVGVAPLMYARGSFRHPTIRFWLFIIAVTKSISNLRLAMCETLALCVRLNARFHLMRVSR